jgi:hypothetical protein
MSRLLPALLALAACDVPRLPGIESFGQKPPPPEANACLISCDDGDKCTVDSCENGVCVHAPRVCPQPNDPCRVGLCDEELGCAVATVDDGTQCGPSSCNDQAISSCFSGECLRLPANSNQLICGDRWAPGFSNMHIGSAWAFDEHRGRLLAFNPYDPWSSNGTWEWDGSTWSPVGGEVAPTQAFGATMAYDRARERVVLFAAYESPPVTWEWDGTGWTEAFPSLGPLARVNQQMFYDTAQRRVGLYGGDDCYQYPCQAQTDIFEWDGLNWIAQPVPQAPSSHQLAGVAYDEARGRLVRFGGISIDGQTQYNETWEWDGAAWELRAPAHAPSPRFRAQLTYDRNHQRTLLLGGVGHLGQLLSDFWEWDGTDWTELTPTFGPGNSADNSYLPQLFAFDPIAGQVLLMSADSRGLSFNSNWWWNGAHWSTSGPTLPVGRSFGAVSYDPKRERVVLFGGRNGECCVDSVALGDTWLWDGASWVNVAGAGPPAREHAMVAFDGTREATLLFGGTADREHPFADTWSFDGTSWVQRHPKASPPARFGAAMGYDSRRRRVVLFGGVSELGAVLGDTWEWDGEIWSEVKLLPGFSPPARAFSGMAYDASRQQMVLFGGASNSDESFIDPLGDTWTFDGTKWTPRATRFTLVMPRQDAAFAYDPRRERVTMFGGFTSFGSASSEIWVFDGSDWFQRQPQLFSANLGGAGMGYDAQRDQFVVFGGTSEPESFGVNDTWLYLPP